MDYGGILVILVRQVSLSIASYAIGYYHCSIIWIILPVILNIIQKKQIKQRLIKRDFFRNLTANDEKAVVSSLANLPSWVYFPDMERAEWLNKIIRQLWPNLNNYVNDIIKDLFEVKLNKKLGKYGLSGLVFEKLAVGLVPFRIGGLVVFENVSEKEVVFDVDITYAGDCDISLKFSKVTGGIKDFQLYGRLRVILKPLINKFPLAGGIQLFFLNPPDIDFTLDGLAGVLEFPVFNEMLRKVILDAICSVIVLPNKFPIQLTKDISKEDIQFPNPKGVLRVHVVQARHLMKRDLTFTGHHTSDPYAILTVGDQEYKTPVREHTAKPQWDYWCEFIIEEINGVYLFISLWDDDTIQEDEPLGRAKVQISQLVEKGKADMWIKLDQVKHGQVQVRTTWLTLSNNQEDLKNAVHEVQQLKVSHLSSAVLIVYVNSAKDLILPKMKKMDIYVKINLGKQEKVTKGFKKQTDPVWQEGYTFLVGNPENDYVTFSLIDEKEDESLGEFVYSINRLFNEEDLRIDKQTFRLTQCKSEGKINLSMTLKILKNSNFILMDDQPSSDEDNHKVFSEDNSSSLSLSSSISSSKSDESNESSDILSKSRIKLTLRYSVQRQRLIVVIHHIEDLHFDETKGLYVKLYLLPERHKESKRKTQVIRTSKNPVFDETFEFLLSQDELSYKQLEVSVCEENFIKNEPIQKVKIDLDKLSLVLPHTKLFNLVKSHHS